ncbi:MAG: glucose-6-phosphate isomerase [Acidobacteria bacterium]|nr:MAG: glucose-6-phosphate isomerase [Acidobacteriota bacterium]
MRSEGSRSPAGGERLVVEPPGVVVDLEAFPCPEPDRDPLAGPIERAFSAMDALEAGAVANPDEGRRVGHYWLRDPDRAPSPEIASAIRRTREEVERFGREVRRGAIRPPEGGRFRRIVHIGIGGSALGPQLVADALPGAPGAPEIEFLDNTDPDGFARLAARLEGHWAEVLAVVVSKSGGTPETRNGLEEIAARLSEAGCSPPGHLVAVTGEGSPLARRARDEGWLGVFPMWEWVGGRTSVTSAVGLLPMALTGRDIDGFLRGAREMDERTRRHDPVGNPAARLARAWYEAGEGRGRRDMVVIPYRDRLVLLARYLQQLVMESLGKRHDLDGREVRQGLTVYGNKGSTDQHAYVQQLRDGLDNYFATLIGVIGDEAPGAREVEPGVDAGDYLLGFLLGTRRALLEDGRRVLAIVLPSLDARRLGGLIALYERAVGLYASLVRVNAYNQPGVEAGKKAAAGILDLQRRLLETLSAERGAARSAAEWASRVGMPEMAFEAGWVLERLAATGRGGVAREGPFGVPEARYLAR